MAAAISSSASAGTYAIDPSHSTVLWHINHLGFSTFSGKWFVNEGKINLDKQHPEKSNMSVTINMKDVDSGIDELNDHLRGPSFFNVTKYPTATFVNNKVKLTASDSADVYGVLTLHNVAKPIVLKMHLNKAGVNLLTNQQAVGFSGTTELKRSDFGITSLLPLLGDDVKIDLNTEGHKTS